MGILMYFVQSLGHMLEELEESLSFQLAFNSKQCPTSMTPGEQFAA